MLQLKSCFGRDIKSGERCLATLRLNLMGKKVTKIGTCVPVIIDWVYFKELKDMKKSQAQQETERNLKHH